MEKRDRWTVYLARCADDSLYTGIAKDVRARLEAHNAGTGAAYTRSRRPLKLVYRKGGFTRSAALVEEARIKSLDRAEKLAFLKKAARAGRRVLGGLVAALLLAGAARAVPTFNAESPVSIASAAPQAVTYTNATTFAYPIRMYYLPAIGQRGPHLSSAPVVLSASSADGLAWASDVGTRMDSAMFPLVSIDSFTGVGVLPLSGGGFRMLYSYVSGAAFAIRIATSADGLAWGDQNTVVVNGGAAYLGSPRMVKLTSGDWRLYYVRDSAGGTALASRSIYSARSTDEGATWGASSIVLSTTAYEIGADKLTDGRVRLFYTQPVAPASSATVIDSALSSDALGSSFAQEANARASTTTVSGGLGFPLPVRSTDTFRWRLYYAYFDAALSTGDAHSLLTGPPAPTSVTPSTIYQSAASNQLAIAGEVFSGGPPTLSLSRGGVLIAGAGVARASDESLTATFATQNQALGLWDLVVTNADGNKTTLTNAVNLDFAPGSVVLSGNLLRPRNGVPASADVTTFAPGRVSVRLYDADGRPIRALYDNDLAAGSTTFTWDGRNASGAVCASGVYLLRVTGPKIDYKGKIVVIR